VDGLRRANEVGEFGNDRKRVANDEQVREVGDRDAGIFVDRDVCPT
jgi:hypothetical protein